MTCEPKAPIQEVILLLRSKCPPHGFPLQPARRREHLGEVLVSHPKFVITMFDHRPLDRWVAHLPLYERAGL